HGASGSEISHLVYWKDAGQRPAGVDDAHGDPHGIVEGGGGYRNFLYQLRDTEKMGFRGKKRKNSL
ncbi:MAG: hypothetical protein LUC90_07730, partial [Lachnospiraceae bacterium]|nr:hypothetical protein [Lachnospiraceae bacterium]